MINYFVLTIPATANGFVVPAIKGNSQNYDDALGLFYTESASMAKAGRPTDGVILMDSMGNELKKETHSKPVEIVVPEGPDMTDTTTSETTETKTE